MHANLTTISGFDFKTNSLAHWANLLEEWILAIERYCRVTQGAAPYWFNERANISVLSGAAWRCGKISLEEFPQSKMQKSDVASAAGRCDLWIADQYTSDHIEAKFLKLKISDQFKIDKVNTRLNDAMDDSKKLMGQHVNSAVGVVFIRVDVPVNMAEKHLDQAIINLITELTKVNYDAMAWCFPTQTRQRKSGIVHAPGVVMIAKTID